MFYKIRARLRR